MDTTDVLARWTAPRTFRREVVMQLEVWGPTVEASTPEELAAAYAVVFGRKGPEEAN